MILGLAEFLLTLVIVLLAFIVYKIVSRKNN